MLQATDLAVLTVSDSAASLLLEGALEGAAILLLGTGCALLARGASAAVRHVIWTLTLTGAFVAPMVGLFLPQWRVAIPGWVGPASAVTGAGAAYSSVTRPHTVIEMHSAPQAGALGRPSTSSRSSTATNSSVSVDVAPALRPVVVETPITPEAAPLAAPAVVTMARARTFGESVGTLRGAGAWFDASVAPWLVTLWLLGLVVSLAPTVVGMARVSALVGRARPMRGGRWALLAPSAMREIDIRRRVRFVELDEPVMPMTCGILRPVVLLPAGDFGSSIAQRLDVLRHELAHVRRHDCLTQLVAQLACGVNWFNPLVWIAAREMRAERERACDDEVLRAGAKASDYADYLLRVARETRMSTAAAFGALAMARPSQLAIRLRAVLDDGRRRERASRSFATLATIGAAFVAALVGMAKPAPADARIVVPVPHAVTAAASELGAPAIAVVDATLIVGEAIVGEAIIAGAPSLGAIDALETRLVSIAVPDVRTSMVSAMLPPSAAECERNARASGKESHSSSISSDDDSKRWRLRWSRGDCSYEVDARGEIRFNRDLTDIESISSGGSFTLEQHDGDEVRRLTIRPGADGALERTYWVNGDRRPFDDAARSWLGEALVAIERRTAFASDQRVPALLQSGGVDAVMREIALLEADYARRRYYTKLLAARELSAPQVRGVVEQAGATISSDYELAELLVAVSALDAFGDNSHKAFVTATTTIESDYERRRTLNALLKRDRLSTATVESLLEAASTIRSDYELAELLIDVSRQYAIGASTRPMYVKAVGSIESDYEHRRVLSAIIAGGGLTPEATRALLDDASRIQSDYELAEFLVAISGKGVLDASTRGAYFAALSGIGSDYEHRRALAPLLERDLMTKELAKGILASAMKIESDYENAELLIALANVITIDQDLRADFDRAAATIESEHEYGRVMSAVRRRVTR